MLLGSDHQSAEGARLTRPRWGERSQAGNREGETARRAEDTTPGRSLTEERGRWGLPVSGGGRSSTPAGHPGPWRTGPRGSQRPILSGKESLTLRHPSIYSFYFKNMDHKPNPILNNIPPSPKDTLAVKGGLGRDPELAHVQHME